MSGDTSKQRPVPIRQWAAAMALVLAATALGQLVDGSVSLTSLAMLYLLAVVLASYRLGWVQAAATAAAGVLALNFFFVPPRWTLAVDGHDDLIALVALLAVSLVISHLVRGLRRETATARLNAQRAHQLQALATGLAAADDAGRIQALGLQTLEQAFTGPVALVVVDTGGPWPESAASIPPHRQDGLRQCMKDKAVLGPGTGRWPGLDGWYAPVADAGQVYGAVLAGPARADDDDGRGHAVALAALLGQALARLHLSQAVQAARAETQRQQLLNTFLAAISHDLRTPLAAIVGAGTSLRDQGDRLTPGARDRLLDSIVSESSRLAVLAENTLQLVRLPAQADLPRAWESLEEIAGAAVARVHAQHPDGASRVSAQVQPGLPLVQADAVLLGQLLANLLDNALRYAAGPIEVSAGRVDGRLQLCVQDHGPGIPPQVRATLFQPFSRNDTAGAHGAGLGLALCQAIARVHGGELVMAGRPGGGTAACLYLPELEQPGDGPAAGPPVAGGTP